MDLYYPRSQIFLTAVHKSGSTSAMNFFGALENYLVKNDLEMSESKNFPAVQLSYKEMPWEIHSDQDLAIQYVVRSDNNPQRELLCSIAIVRDPLERFTSFWFNKIVLMRDSTYHELAKTYFQNVEISNMESIRENAKEFLKSDQFSKRFLSDAHLKPQTLSIQVNRKYDLVIETKELNQIPQRLVEKFPQFCFMESSKFPHYNNTEKELTGSFYDNELVNLVLNAYSEDVKLLEKENLTLSHHKAHYGGEPEPGVLDQLNNIRAKEIANLMMLAMDSIAAERDSVLNSRIWRFTRFYRESKLLNRKNR